MAPGISGTQIRRIAATLKLPAIPNIKNNVIGARKA